MIDRLHPDYGYTPAAPGRPTFYYRAKSQARPAVTIVTPFHNTGPVFHETARCVLGQSLQQWEWIIVNDASTDPEAVATLATYRARDPRIQVVDSPTNVGPGGARNLAIKLASAPFIANIDSDDLFEPTALEKWIWYLVSHPEHAFVKSYSLGFGAQQYLWPRAFDRPQDFLSANQVNPNGAVRSSVFERIGLFDESIRDGMEDWEFWMRCADAGLWGGTIPEYLEWYRRRDNHSLRWSDWDSSTRQRAFLERLKGSYPRLWKRGMPNALTAWPQPYTDPPRDTPFCNELAAPKRRVLLIVPWMTMGGADKFTRDLVAEWSRRDIECTVVATEAHDNPWAHLFSRITPDIFILPRFLQRADYPRFLLYLARSRAIDAILVTQSYFGYDLLPFLRANLPDVALMDYVHMEEASWRNGGYPKASLDHVAELDVTVTSSAHLKRWMTDRGGAAERTLVVNTNIDPQEWDPAAFNREAVRSELGIGPDTTTILFAGRMTAQKQPRLFCDVMLSLRQMGLSYAAIVAGDGEDLPYIKTFSKRHQLDNIKILGSVSNDKMKALLAASDIFLLPSLHEGISLAVFEAMAMACVPVSADVGGQSELVTPECGRLVSRSADEQRDYCNVLRELIESPDLRLTLASNARQRIRDMFTIDKMCDGMSHALTLASERHMKKCPPAIELSTAWWVAKQVIEQARIQGIADALWLQQQAVSRQGLRIPFDHSFKAGLRAMLGPLYHWGMNNGFAWLHKLRPYADHYLGLK